MKAKPKTKVFINKANGYFEIQASRLLKDQHEIFGTVSKNGKENVFLKEIVENDSKSLKKAVLESDILIFRLSEGISEAKFAIKVLEGTMYKNKKTFVLISSMMSWACTPKQFIEDENEEEDEENEENEEKKKKVEPPKFLGPNGEDLSKQYEAFHIDQVITRKAHRKYLSFIEMEKRVRKAKCSTLRPIIIYPGLLYGEGEHSLHPFFKQVWKGPKKSMPETPLLFYNSGLNYVPMIHVNDLGSILQCLVAPTKSENEEEEEEEEEEDSKEIYHFAVDGAKSKYEEIIKCIASEFGLKEGAMSCNDEKQMRSFYEGDLDEFTWDCLEQTLQFSPSEYLDSLENLKWMYKEGFIKNIKKIRKEYEKVRNLTPLKIALFGPPSSGKTAISKMISAKYKIPHILTGDLIQNYFAREEVLKKEIERLSPKKKEKEGKKKKKKKEKEVDDDDDDERGDEDEREEKVEEESSELKSLKKELKKILSLKSKLAEDKKSYSDETIAEVFREKLREREYRNHGWILDGFPKNVNQAKFLLKIATDNNEEEEEEEIVNQEGEEEGEEVVKKDTVDSIMLPEFLISLKVEKPEETLKVRVGDDDVAKERFDRRLNTYNENSLQVLQFLEQQILHSENGKQPLTKELKGDDDLSLVFRYVEEFVGEPHNYGPSKEEIEAEGKKKEEIARKEKERIEMEKRKEAERIENEKKERELLLKEAEKKLEEIKKQEREMLQVRSLPLREYLMKNVLPSLTKGLVEVCQVKPEDPVDHLANYLFKISETNVEKW